MEQSKIEMLTDKYLMQRANNLKQILDIQYRLELVDTIDGVEYVNDSKSTNVTATLYALSCMENNIIWIVDSHDLQQEYSVLGDFVQSKVKKIIALGHKAEAILSTFPTVPGVAYNKLDELRDELKEINAGEMVLYSPACPTDDRYTDYKQRGKRFNQLVADLKVSD